MGDVILFFKLLLVPNIKAGVLYQSLSQGPGCHLNPCRTLDLVSLSSLLRLRLSLYQPTLYLLFA